MNTIKILAKLMDKYGEKYEDVERLERAIDEYEKMKMIFEKLDNLYHGFDWFDDERKKEIIDKVVKIANSSTENKLLSLYHFIDRYDMYYKVDLEYKDVQHVLEDILLSGVTINEEALPYILMVALPLLTRMTPKKANVIRELYPQNKR